MAKTSLAAQLQLLKTPQTTAHRETKGSVSLLYDFFEAKSIDSNTHYSVALDGLEGLTKLDYGLARYKESLFHESSKSLDRSIMTAEENEKLDQLLEEYLFTVVSKYFQITDTMKTLEWLVYRYKIHLYNVDAYVGSVLPYHGTRQFARVLQTVSKIKDPGSVRWYWLKQIQLQAVPLSINVLVQHCTSNTDFFRYVIDSIFKAIKIDETNVRFASFFVMFSVKALEHSKSEEVVAMVLAGVSKALKKNAKMFYSPTCVVLSHLSSLVQLDAKVLNKVLKLYASRFTKPHTHKTFLTFNIVAKTQELEHFPEEYLSGIILPELANWAVKNRNCDSLIILLFGTLVHFASNESLNHAESLERIENILKNKAIMKKQTVLSIVGTINDKLDDDEQEVAESTEQYFRSVIRLFEQYYPLTLNSVKVAEPMEVEVPVEETYLESLSSMTLDSVVQSVRQNPQNILEKKNLQEILASALLKSSDSSRRGVLSLSLAFSKIFAEDKKSQESAGSAILECIRFAIANFELGKCSRKIKLQNLTEMTEESIQESLRETADYEFSKIPTSTLCFLLHKLTSGHKFEQKNPWSMIGENGEELIAYKTFKILLFLSSEQNREFSPSRHTFELFGQLFENFLEKIAMPPKKDVFAFFLPTLISDNLPSFRLETLTILQGLMTKDEELGKRFAESAGSDKKVIICHLLALSSNQQECRQSVLNNLETLHASLPATRRRDDTSAFLTELLQRKNDMLLDHKVLPKAFAKMQGQKYVQSLVDELLEALFKGLLPVECRAGVIALFVNFDNAIRERIFQHYCGAFTDFEKLTSGQERELHALLSYFSYHGANLLEKADSFSAKFYLKVLAAAETSLPIDACVLIFRAFEYNFRSMVDKNFQLTMQITQNILEMELRVSESGLSNRRVNHMKLISWLRRSISSVVSDGGFMAELMKNILDVEEATTSMAALLKDAPSKKKSKIDSAELTGRYLRSWKLLRILIGSVQGAQVFTNPSILMKSLFNYFNAALTELCDPSIMEHTRQIILYAISHLIETIIGNDKKAITDTKKTKLSAADKKKNEERRVFLEQIDIDSIVHCLSESRYQDTQRIALLSLSMLSSHFHEQILKSLVAIFGFIGTSLLQCDDQYSLAILYETIESIIPMVLQNSGDKAEERRHYILSIFLDYLKNIPSYRRLVLFTKLIHQLGEEKFLPFFTVSLYEKKYLQYESTKKEERDGFSALALSVFQAFPIGTQIRSACALLSVFESQFFEIIFTKVNLIFDRKSLKKLEVNAVAKEFKLKLKTEDRQLACGVDLLKFILELVSNPEFRFAVNNLFVERVETPTDDMEELETPEEREARIQQEEIVKSGHLQALTYFFHLLIEMIVSLGPKEAHTRSNSFQFRRRVRDILDDILTNFNQLFPPVEILDLIIDKMLKNSYNVDKQLFVFVQRRALRLMFEKLSALDEREISRAKALQLLDSLLLQLPASFKSIEKNREQIHNVQNLMLAFKACFKFVNDTDPKEKNELELLTVLLQKIIDFTKSIQMEKKRSSVEVEDKSLSNIKGSCLICLVKVFCSMPIQGLAKINDVMTLLLDNFGSDDEVILISNICALSSVMQKFPKLLSPFLSKIILALLPAFQASEQELGVRSRLQFAWNLLAKDVEKRTLFKAISDSYRGACEISPQATIELFGLLKKSCANVSETENPMKHFETIMLAAMSYRGDHIGSVDLKTIEEVETSIGDAFSAFFPKLNESQFRPLFHKLLASTLPKSADKEPEVGDKNHHSLKKTVYYRMIAFYRFCSQLADSLRSLFCVFVAPAIVKNASEMLVAYHSANSEDKDEDEERLHTLAEGSKLRILDSSVGEPLISAILSTFSKCFLFDLQGTFARDDSVNMIVKPLIAQISNVSGSLEDYQTRIELILQCTQYLIQNNKDETLIKEFNYQILLKTRESEEKVRIGAIRVLHRLILTCAEEYLSFIPEAIPYISEMCEDHSDAVDTHLKKLIIDIEQLVGEPIKKYL